MISRKKGKDRNKSEVPKVNASEKDQGGDTRDETDKEPGMAEPQLRQTPRGPGTQLLEVSGGLGIEFPECIRNRYGEDPFFEPILDNAGDFTNFKMREGLTFFVSEGIEVVAIPDIKVNDLGVRELLIQPGHSVLAHLGAKRPPHT